MPEKVTSTTGLTPEQVKERTVSGNLPMMYFNYVRVASSFFDMRLFFGQGNITPKGEHTFQEELCVSMSIEFAKILRDNITSQLDAYEKNFGNIRPAPTQTTTESHSVKEAEKKERKKPS